MKNNISLLSSLICIICFTSFSCNDSCDFLCESEEPRIFIRILNSSDASDLVYGDNKVYDLEKLSIFNLDNEDTTFYKLETFEDAIIGSILTVDHDNFMISKAFVDYGNTDVDTLDFMFNTSDTECCGMFRSLKTVFHNGTQIYDNVGAEIVTIRK